jgi:hypothetical protein
MSTAVAVKPLHVRVAEALGCRVVRDNSKGTYTLKVPHGVDQISFVTPEGAWTAAPRYDTAWSVTGPLIERYGIALEQAMQIMDPPKRGRTWVAASGGIYGYGADPLRAVCDLILALHAAGKLP